MEKFYYALIRWLDQKDSLAKIRNVSLIFLVAALLTGTAMYYAMNEVVNTPCSPSQYPGRCYRIPQDVCQSQWDRSVPVCLQQIQKLQLSPTRLIGPIQFKCQLTHLDRLFNTARITSDGCNELHIKLDQWKITNPDF